MAKSSQDRADYTFDNLQPFGVGRHRNPSPDIDSRLGAQLTANLTPQLSALLQVVSEYSWDGSYRPAVTWANVSYALAPDLSLRLGRIGIASFMASDSRRVGYSNVTARPPIEVYRLLVLRESDGIDARIRFSTGDFKHDLSVLYGRRTVINTRGQHVHSTDVGGLFDTIEHGDFSLHLAVEGRHVDNQNPPLGMFYSLGATYDPGRWFISSEWVRAVNNDAKGLKITRDAAYVLTGIHIETLTPFASVSELRPRSDTGQPPVAQRSYAAGLRWDPMRHLDLKIQVDHIQLSSNSYGTLQNVTPGTPRGSSLNVLSLMLDFFY
ncbi:hypothetical protein [Roseateles koreensis]|nr:hypothetical protein [Roseateles koreensis]